VWKIVAVLELIPWYGVIVAKTVIVFMFSLCWRLVTLNHNICQVMLNMHQIHTIHVFPAALLVAWDYIGVHFTYRQLFYKSVSWCWLCSCIYLCRSSFLKCLQKAVIFILYWCYNPLWVWAPLWSCSSKFSWMQSLAPHPTSDMEHQGLHLVWPLPFDLSGLWSCRHSSSGHWGMH
jgi:hypothetical protein